MFTFYDALILSIETHKNQKDRGGDDYIKHPLHVAHEVKVRGYDDNTQMAALLHDTLEDGMITIENLRYTECPIHVIEALRLLTHVTDEKFILDKINNDYKRFPAKVAENRAKKDEYLEYIKRLSGNKIAKTVKIEDLKHNLDVSRLKQGYRNKEKAILRTIKYKSALEILLKKK